MLVLTKEKPTLSLEKGATTGNIDINLNWSQGEKKKGFLASIFGGSDEADLDLGCLYELKNGKKGCVQALGNAFGSLDRAPYIRLDGDDRTGAVTTGENMSVNMKHWEEIERVLIYSFIYEGAKNWAGIDGVITLKATGNEDVVVKMDNAQNGKGMCAIAMLENVNGAVVVRRVEEYFTGHMSMDRAHNWGMNWKSGRK